MARNTEVSLARALGRRAAQVVLVGTVAATPLAFTTGLASADTNWDQLAQCESSGNWNTNTGNGFGGGLQFTDSTWHAFGGSGQPENASREEQIQVAERVKAEQGMSAWPSCSQQTGNTDSSPNSSGSGSSSSASSDSGSSGASSTEGVAAQPAAKGGAYTVAGGDTLSAIAASHGTTVATVAAANGITNPDTISPGQQLKLA